MERCILRVIRREEKIGSLLIEECWKVAVRIAEFDNPTGSGGRVDEE